MRASNSGIRLTDQDAVVIKGMIKRGDRQHDIAAWFGVNAGRIAEVATGRTFRSVETPDRINLPPRGPYTSGRDARFALEALASAQQALASAEAFLRRHASV